MTHKLAKQSLQYCRAHTRSHVHWDTAQRSTPIEARVGPTYKSQRVSWGGKVDWLTEGARTLVPETQGILSGMSSPRGILALQPGPTL